MDILAYLAIAVIAYLLGSISTGMLVSKAMGGPDLHKVGSGNTGATNALRTMGKKGGAIVFAGDVVKALLACLVGRLWMGQNGALLATCSSSSDTTGRCSLASRAARASAAHAA